MKLVFRITVILLLVALLVSVLMRNKQKIIHESKSAKEVIEEIPVEVTKVKMNGPLVLIRAAGIVESSEEVIVISTVQGSVKSVNCAVGKTVKQGEVLVTADDYFVLQEYTVAREAYEQLQREYNRYRELSGEGAVTGQQLEQMQIQLDGADAKQKSLYRRLEDTEIKAPVNGVINQVFVKKGGVLGNGSPVCEIVNPSGLKVAAHVTESDLSLLENGQQVTLSENSGIGITYPGVVAGMGVKPDRTGLYPVSISLPDKVSGIQPGMLLNTEIRVTGDPAILVPRRIITKVGGEQGVYVAVSNLATFKKIVPGKTYKDATEVISGLEEGMLLITEGYQFLNDGRRLKIVKEQK